MGKIENDLKNLCLDLLNVLQILEKSNKITKEEYDKYSKSKITFLEEIDKLSS